MGCIYINKIEQADSYDHITKNITYDCSSMGCGQHWVECYIFKIIPILFGFVFVNYNTTVIKVVVILKKALLIIKKKVLKIPQVLTIVSLYIDMFIGRSVLKKSTPSIGDGYSLSTIFNESFKTLELLFLFGSIVTLEFKESCCGIS